MNLLVGTYAYSQDELNSLDKIIQKLKTLPAESAIFKERDLVKEFQDSFNEELGECQASIDQDIVDPSYDQGTCFNKLMSARERFLQERYLLKKKLLLKSFNQSINKLERVYLKQTKLLQNSSPEVLLPFEL